MSREYLLFLTVIAAKTAVVLVFLVVAFRIGGKRQVGQMNIYDLAMVMAVANAVQNAMTHGNGNLTAGIASAGTLFVLGWLITRLLVRLPKLECHVIGKPTVLLNNGRIIEAQMRREYVTREELMLALRAHGLTDPREVKMAVLEVDGSISVVPSPAKQHKPH